jgi:site-specific recombinase XerD
LTNRTYTIESFARHTQNMAMKAVKEKHIQAWIGDMEVAASTIRQRISDLRAFFRWAIDHGIVKHDPTLRAKAPRQPRSTPRSVPLKDLTELGKALPDDRARAVIALMLHMGLRAGEVAGLEMADVALFSNTMRVVGKGGHERILPIPEVVRLWLDPYLAERGRGGGKVIRSMTHPTQGVRPQTISHMVTKWMREAGVKSAPYDGRSAHALRHTMCENLYLHGVDLRTIAAAAGHASPTTTWTYLRHKATVEQLRDVMGQQIIEEQRPSLRPVPEFAPPSIAEAS